jgi:hypothetical protein
MEKLSFKNLRARRSSLVEETVDKILEAEEGPVIHAGYPEWFAEAVRDGDISDAECEAVVEAVFLVLCDALWENLTDEIEKFRGKQD